MTQADFQRVRVFLAVPWAVFVAAFLYYTLLALVVVSGVDLGAPLVAAVYAVPPLCYLVTVSARVGGTLASLRVEVFRTPHALAN